MGASRAANTVAAYANSWRVFTRWCADSGRVPLPATSETVSRFCAWCIDQERRRLDTVRLHLAVILHYHGEGGFLSPVTRDVRDLMAHAARLLREQPGGKAALRLEQLWRSVYIAVAIDSGAIAVSGGFLESPAYAGSSASFRIHLAIRAFGCLGWAVVIWPL